MWNRNLIGDIPSNEQQRKVSSTMVFTDSWLQHVDPAELKSANAYKAYYFLLRHRLGGSGLNWSHAPTHHKYKRPTLSHTRLCLCSMCRVGYSIPCHPSLSASAICVFLFSEISRSTQMQRPTWQKSNYIVSTPTKRHVGTKPTLTHDLDRYKTDAERRSE